MVVKSEANDIDEMNILSYQKLRSYETAQTIFWKWAGKPGETVQKNWFLEFLKCEKHICLTAKSSNQVIGFIIGKITEDAEVYIPLINEDALLQVLSRAV